MPTVRAVYDFEGHGPSSLSFRKGDVIEVLTRLESGWWSGICRGERGYFPSNYVEPHQDDPYYAATRLSQTANPSTGNLPPASTTQGSEALPEQPAVDVSTEPRGSRASSLSQEPALPSAAKPDSSILPLSKPRRSSGLPPGWGIKHLSNGQVYYYHLVTDLTTWTLDDVDPDTGIRMLPSQTPSASTVTLAKDRRRGSAASSDSQSSLVPLGDVSMWAFNLQLRPSARQRRPSISTGSASLLGGGDPAVIQSPTWERLSASVVYAIQQLTNACKSEAKYEYLALVLGIVRTVHTMFRASDTVERDAPIFRSQKLLKAHHRHVTNSLCKLVISAKRASVVWPPPDATTGLHRDASELLLAVRHFVIAAEDCNLQLHAVDEDDGSSLHARFPSTASRSAMADYAASMHDTHGHMYDDMISNKHLKHVDILAQLETTLRTLAKAITLLLRHLKRSEVSLVRIVTLAKKTVYEVGQFLLLMEELDLELAGDRLTREFNSHKQALYSDLANMVLSIQAASREDSAPQLTEGILVHTNALNNSVYEVMVIAKHVVEAMDHHEEAILLNAIDKLRAASPSSSYSDLSTQPRRAQSMPYLREQLDLTAERHLSAYDYSMLKAAGNLRLRSNSSAVGNGANSVGAHMPQSNGSTSNLSTHGPATARPLNGGGSSRMSYASQGSSLDSDSEDSVHRYNRSVSTLNRGKKLKKFFGDEALLPPPGRAGSSSQAAGGRRGSGSEGIPGQPMGLPFPNATESKLAKFFGEQAPLVSPAAARAQEEKPWYLQYEYDSSELLFNMEVQVKGGTLRALVERLTAHDVSDINFCNTFLLTYRSFTTTNEFLDLLIKRYTIQPPPGLKPEELEVWVERKLRPVRVRVYNIIKMWLESHYVEDSDMDGLRMLREFACTIMADSMSSAAEQVVKSIDKRRQSSDGSFKKLVRNLPKQAPPPILPRNLRKLKVFDIDPLELARQFTILDSKMYNRI
ncbi:hypothetical protein H4R35_006790, partial [Dimargaris xerosporica]